MKALTFPEPIVEDRGYTEESQKSKSDDFIAVIETVGDDGYFRGEDSRYLHIDNSGDFVLELFASSTQPRIAHGVLSLDDEFIKCGLRQHLVELETAQCMSAHKLMRAVEDFDISHPSYYKKVLSILRNLFGDFWLENRLIGLNNPLFDIAENVAPDVGLKIVDDIQPFHVVSGPVKTLLHSSQARKASEPDNRYLGRRLTQI